MCTITALRGRPYVALQLLTLLGVFDGEVVGHLREPDAVCFLTVFSLREKGQTSMSHTT